MSLYILPGAHSQVYLKDNLHGLVLSVFNIKSQIALDSLFKFT